MMKHVCIGRSLGVFVAAMVSVPLLSADIEDYGPIILEEVASGLSRPLFVTAPPGDTGRLFVVEQTGSIRILDRETGEVNSEPFLQLPSGEIPSVSGGDERGFLGMAFHPDYDENGYFYVNFMGNNQTTVRRYRVSDDPDVADAGSGSQVISFSQPHNNHNAGWLGFGPDGYLYIATGDGGSGNDPGDHGQNPETILGSILRIDVDEDDFPGDNNRNYAIPTDNPFYSGPPERTGAAPSPASGEEGLGEVWAYGLRNPWRSSFDRETGDLWIADVGQDNREEINFQPADSTGGENYGWRLREGSIATPTGGVGGDRPPNNVDPIYDYEFNGRRSITGGYVYRGQDLPQLRGMYFYADYVADFIESFRYEGEPIGEDDIIDWTDTLNQSIDDTVFNISSFGEDAEGELYLTALQQGRVYRITQKPWYLWRNRHFTEAEIADTDVSGPEAMPARDGVTNAMKYALGLPPSHPAGRLPIETEVQSHDEGDFLTMTIDRNPDATDVEFVVESSSDLGETDPWSADNTVVVEETAGRLIVRDSMASSEEGRRFLRLRVVRPPDGPTRE